MTIQESMNHFWEGLKTGKLVPKTEGEIKNFIHENHFGGEAIKELNKKDKEIVEKSIFEHLEFMFNKDTLKKLCEQEMVYLQDGRKRGHLYDPYFILEDRMFNEGEIFKREKAKGNVLSKEKKLELFSNPDNWYYGTFLNSNISEPFISWGMRHLESYGFSKEEFEKIIKQVKKNTKKNLLNILDVGGAGGIALKDIKDSFPKKVITNNLTLDIEPVTYDFDNLYLCAGERFPKKLQENMDIIISNMTFLYMPGQNLALENCLQSLSVGGEAYLNVGWGKQDSFISDFPNRMAEQYQRMIELKNKGFIKLRINSGKFGDHALTYVPRKEDNNWFPPAWVEIKKLKSLKD